MAKDSIFKNIMKTITEKASPFLWKLNALKREPVNLDELRDHMSLKLRSQYDKGYFVFSLTAKDGQPILLVSSESKITEGINVNYYKIAFDKKPGDEIKLPFIHGTYEARANVLHFTAEPELKGKSPKETKLYDDSLKSYMKAKLSDVAEAFWASFGPIDATLPKAIFLNNVNLVPEKMKKGRWVVAEYNLSRVLLNDKSSPKLPGEMQETENGQRAFVTPQGIRIGEDSTIQLEVFGAIAATADAQQLMMNIMQAGLAEVFGKHFSILKTKLLKCEAELQGDKVTPEKALLNCEKALDEFSSNFQQEGMLLVQNKWTAYIYADYTKRRYEIKAGIGIAINAIGVVGGVTTAITTGVTGVGGAVGLLLTVRKSMNLAADIYTFFRDIETVRKLLERQLTAKTIAYLQNGSTEDWKEVGRDFLEVLKISKPLNAVSDLFGGEKNTKSVTQLRKDMKEYQAKIAKTNDADEKLLQNTQKLIEEATALESVLGQVTDKKEKARRTAHLEEIRAQVTDQLNLLSTLGEQLNQYLLSVGEFERLLVILEGNQWSDKNAKAANDLLLPVLKTALKLRPKELLGNAIGVGGCVVKVGVKGYALYEYCNDPANAPKESAQLSKLLDEVAQITKNLDGLRAKVNPSAAAE